MFPSALSPKMAKVGPHSCWDGVVNGVAGDEEFENILSILDFPMESLEEDGFVGDWDVSKAQYLGPIPSDVLIGPPTIAQPKIETGPPTIAQPKIETGPPVLMHRHTIAQSKTETGPPVLMHRQVALIDAIPEPRQLSYGLEETSGPFLLRENKSTMVQDPGVFQSQSPVSVLENNGSSLARKSSLIKSRTNKRTRSKRARPSGVSPWLLISPLFSTSNAYSGQKTREGRKKTSPLERARKTTQDSCDTARNSFPDYGELRKTAVTKKCAHCEVTKTPQWREGPMGPKTLCNACGVRYRSGRLYPEYRPAASPTFVPSLHSNSHKKVIEMRTKSKQQHQVSKVEQCPISLEPEFSPVSGCFL